MNDQNTSERTARRLGFIPLDNVVHWVGCPFIAIIIAMFGIVGISTLLNSKFAWWLSVLTIFFVVASISICVALFEGWTYNNGRHRWWELAYPLNRIAFLLFVMAGVSLWLYWSISKAEDRSKEIQRSIVYEALEQRDALSFRVLTTDEPMLVAQNRALIAPYFTEDAFISLEPEAVTNPEDGIYWEKHEQICDQYYQQRKAEKEKYWKVFREGATSGDGRRGCALTMTLRREPEQKWTDKEIYFQVWRFEYDLDRPAEGPELIPKSHYRPWRIVQFSGGYNEADAKNRFKAIVRTLNDPEKWEQDIETEKKRRSEEQQKRFNAATIP